MARIPYPEPDELPPEHAELFNDIRRRRGSLPNIFRILSHSPDVLLRRLALGESLRNDTIIDAKLRELAILVVTRLNGGGYEFVAHSGLALKVGVSQQQIDNVASFETSALFDDRERGVMRYAAEATANIRVQDSTWAAIAGFLNNRELVELVMNVAWYNQTARITFPLQIDEEQV